MKNTFRLLVGMAVVGLTLHASAVAYWNCSSPTGPASGTWNQTNPTWTDSSTYGVGGPLGGPTDPNPKSWNSGLQGADASSFSLGQSENGMPAPYTITVDNSGGQVGTGDILVYTGPLTLTGGKLDIVNIINGTPSATTDAGMVFIIHTGQIAYMNLNLTNSVGPYSHTSASGDVRPVFGNKEGRGTLYLGAANSFIGDIAVKTGVLGITVDQSIPSASSLILLNGSDIGGGADQESDTPPVFNTGGHNQTLDQLVLDGPNSLIPRTIDFQDGHGTLAFSGDSSTNAWSSSASTVFGDSNPGPLTLVITNYQIGTARLRFGTSSSGLTAAQLAQIKFADYTNAPGRIDSNGYVTPVVPQPVATIEHTVTVRWTAISGTHYQIQSSDTVNGTYSNLAVVLATSTAGAFTDVTSGPNQKFYKVVQL
jgi:autotransporter-associated beta strand protein